MEKPITYNNYPLWIVFITNFTSLFIYGLGIYITFRLNWIVAFLYFFLILFMEIRLISKHCINCYYWGRTCGFGKGYLSALFFKKGNPADFRKKEITWKHMIPDLMVSLIPFIVGIVLLISDFNFIVLLAILVLIILSTAGNGYVRGSLTCKHCKQKELGCPADKLFNKNK